MTYIFKQKLKIQDLVDLDIKIPKILIYEPHDYLAELYAHYLIRHNFQVKHCQDLAKFLNHVSFFQPEGVVFNIENDDSKIFAKNILKNIPNLKIITTAYNISHDNIKILMDIGSVSHMNRRFTRPADLPTMLKTIFYQN